MRVWKVMLDRRHRLLSEKEKETFRSMNIQLFMILQEWCQRFCHQTSFRLASITLRKIRRMLRSHQRLRASLSALRIRTSRIEAEVEKSYRQVRRRAGTRAARCIWWSTTLAQETHLCPWVRLTSPAPFSHLSTHIKVNIQYSSKKSKLKMLRVRLKSRQVWFQVCKSNRYNYRVDLGSKVFKNKTLEKEKSY